jgi:hypothetical protein
MLLVRSPVPDYTEIVARLAAAGDAASDGPLPELDGTRPERRLAALLLRLRSEQQSIAEDEDEDEPLEGLLKLERELARAHRDYLSGLFFADADPPTSGVFCAIEVEAALETRSLGYPAPSPANALALRALVRHGVRVVLVTNDPFDDLRERCDAYRVYGGLAERGAVAYDHTTGETVSLVSDESRVELEALRATLLYVPGVHVDRGSRVGVRAYRSEGDGGLEPALAAWALADAGVDGHLQALPAERHTDFTAVGIDSEVSLVEVRARLGAAGPDGLTGEVRELLGHRPGRCSTCRPPRLSPEAKALLRALGAAGTDLPSRRHGLAIGRLARKAA